MGRPAWRTGRQSVPRMAHLNQQALRLQFPTEPRFLRLNHEPCSFPIDWDGDSIVRLVRWRGATRCGPKSHASASRDSIVKTQAFRAIKGSKSCESAERFAGRGPARYR